MRIVNKLVRITHRAIGAKGARIDEVQDDRYGPGPGVKWFHLEDPEGNQVFRVQA
jgi:hypothetical protein